MEEFVIPKVASLIYEGQKVLSTPQLAAIFKCKCGNISVNFRNNRNIFAEGVDYFFLKGNDFKAFRQSLIMENVGEEIASQMIIAPFAKGATSVYLWTESGVLKLSKIISTDNAKLIYFQLKAKYFTGEINGDKTIAPQEIKPQNANEQIEPQKIKPQSNEIEKAKMLVKMAELCTDENLRDNLIKVAFEYLTGETI